MGHLEVFAPFGLDQRDDNSLLKPQHMTLLLPSLPLFRAHSHWAQLLCIVPKHDCPVSPVPRWPVLTLLRPQPGLSSLPKSPPVNRWWSSYSEREALFVCLYVFASLSVRRFNYLSIIYISVLPWAVSG